MEKIVFLDILIVRNNNTLEAIVYRKKTHKGVYYITNLSRHQHGNVVHYFQYLREPNEYAELKNT